MPTILLQKQTVSPRREMVQEDDHKSLKEQILSSSSPETVQPKR